MNGGTYNTAAGYEALYSNATGTFNAAFGSFSLLSNTSGGANTALSNSALKANTTGASNTAAGSNALFKNTIGAHNTAISAAALQDNTTGIENTAAGYNALLSNIYGIDNTAAVSSSERFKTDIEPMGGNTARLQQLRPVTVHYKADAQGTLRYGLIAEEVAKVYPELLVRDSQGRIDGVRYDELAPMLLNEMQKQQAQMAERFAAQTAEITALKQQVAKVNGLESELIEMRAALATLQSKDQLVARR